MNPKQLTLSADEKFQRYLLATLILIIGTGFAALGLYCVFAGIIGRADDPRVMPAGMLVAIIGVGANWLAIVLINEARNAKTRSY